MVSSSLRKSLFQNGNVQFPVADDIQELGGKGNRWPGAGSNGVIGTGRLWPGGWLR